jgi:hypothetical protein
MVRRHCCGLEVLYFSFPIHGRGFKTSMIRLLQSTTLHHAIRCSPPQHSGDTK